MIPVTIIITTLNEAKNLPRCLAALKNFEEVIVVDSGSDDQTVEIAEQYGARVENFQWNGAYPKKRQWCLDNLNIKNDFVFWVDGDEELTSDLIVEISYLDFKAAGYFVKGCYCWQGKVLKYGLVNNKLALINRHKIKFPVIDDLGEGCMGEMEGHYQPVLKSGYEQDALKQLSAPLRHFACEDQESWERRHRRYALWEANMIARHAYPKDPDRYREMLKTLFRRLPFRGVIAFMHCYFYKRGFLDGAAGLSFAKSRYNYYRMVSKNLRRVLKTNKALGQNVLIDK